MKLTTGILAVVMMTGAAWGQNPGANDNTGSGKSPQQTKANDTNATLAAAVPAAKPAPGAPAPAVKPAIIPGAKPAAAAPAQAAAKPASAASRNNTLDKVSVVRKGDDVQIEISSREAVTPKVTKLTSPVRVLVELPETAMATAQNKIPVGSAGVKGVRIGMDGKTPPTTSVVVDLEQAYAYEVTPGPGNKLVLTLHTKGGAPVVAKSNPASTPAPAKTAAPAPKQTASAKPVAASQAPAPAKTSTPAAKTVAMTPAAVPAAKSTPALATAKPAATAPVVAGKVEAPKTAAKPAAPTTKIAAKDTEKPAASGKPEAAKTAEAPKAPKPEEKKWAMNGKRDPFFSPVVQQTAGSGCSTGKKCLDIGQINLRGVVKSESGFIAVVTNSLNKAYFLHENDPVFNGYVVRITGDSVVFQETVQDKLGKPLTREVVKRIFTPAV
jgi:Tfp pilus assembly protein PilP